MAFITSWALPLGPFGSSVHFSSVQITSVQGDFYYILDTGSGIIAPPCHSSSFQVTLAQLISSQALDQRYCFSMSARFTSDQFGSRWHLPHPRHWLRDHWSSCRSGSFQITLAQGGIYYVLTFTTGSKDHFPPCYSSSVQVTSAQDGIYYVFMFTTGSKITYHLVIPVQLRSRQLRMAFITS